MVRRGHLIVAFLLFSPISVGADEIAELRAEIAQLTTLVRALENQISAPGEAAHTNSPIAALDLHDDTVQPHSPRVDLGINEQQSISAPADAHVLANPWWQNFEISGFAAAGVYDTGTAGTRNHGGFEIKEAALFIEADIWENALFFLELQTNRLGRDSAVFTRTGEVYLHFRDIHVAEDFSFGMKLGRIDIPFGEEYLWQDAIDNPLIQDSAAWACGTDEGLLVYSAFKSINWIVSVTDGALSRSIEDDSEKAWNVEIYGNPIDALKLSFSFMSNGSSKCSALQFAGSFLQPVGASHLSTLGDSPSESVDNILGEIDAIYSFALSPTVEGRLALSFGAAKQDDNESAFDRDFRWFSVEPSVSFKRKWYAVARLSEIGTYDADQGYHFSAKIYAGGNAAFGYDTRRLRRLELGFGWTPNPNPRVKFEVGKDWFDLSDASPLSTNNDERTFAGVEVATKF
jgi:hypothetical protein